MLLQHHSRLVAIFFRALYLDLFEGVQQPGRQPGILDEYSQASPRRAFLRATTDIPATLSLLGQYRYSGVLPALEGPGRAVGVVRWHVRVQAMLDYEGGSGVPCRGRSVRNRERASSRGSRPASVDRVQSLRKRYGGRDAPLRRLMRDRKDAADLALHLHSRSSRRKMEQFGLGKPRIGASSPAPLLSRSARVSGSTQNTASSSASCGGNISGQVVRAVYVC